MAFINKNVPCRGDFQLKFFGNENLTPERKFKTKQFKKKHLDFYNVWCVPLPQFLVLGLFRDPWSPLYGINAVKLHWMQSLVPVLGSGRADPRCEQGWWWHREAQQGFLHRIYFPALSEQLCKAGKTHPNPGKHIQTQEREIFHSAGAQGDPQQGTKPIPFQPPIEVDGICAPQPMKVFGKFQPWRLIISL